jgi:hypothetical protein
MILAYDTGGLLSGGSSAPARRVGLFTDEEFSYWNGDAKTLALRSILWAGGCAGTGPTSSISGTVYHDVDADADVAEGGTLTFDNATVKLYLDDGDGVI